MLPKYSLFRKKMAINFGKKKTFSLHNKGENKLTLETGLLLAIVLMLRGCEDSSVVEYRLRIPWTGVQLLIQEPR